jgi:hypothetical protein
MNDFLTPEQLSKRWKEKFGKKITPGTLGVWRCEGKGPRYCKPVGSVLYPMDEVLKYEKEMVKARL